MAFGTPVAGTVFYRAGGTVVSPAYPAGIQSTDVVLMFAGQKPSLGTGGEVNVGEVNPPPGWTKRGEFYQGGGYTAVPGIDTGNTNLRVFSWDTPVAGQTGSASFYTDTVSNVLWAFIVRIPSGENALVYGSASGQNTVEPTGFLSVALTDDATATNFQAGDLAIWAMCIPTDVTTPNQFSVHSITATGAVFDTATELREPDTALGSDIGGFAAYSIVTSGSSTTSPTIETEVAGTFTNVRGPIVLLRVREGPPIIVLTSAPILPVSESWSGSGLVNNKKPTTGGGRWQITSSQNPAGYNAGQASTTVADGYSSFRHSFTLTDATISTTVYPGSDAGYNIPIQVFARSTPGPTADITDGYFLYVQYFQISLNKRVAGVASTIVSTSVDTTGLPLSFSVIGSIITVLLNNVQVIQVTDTSITISGYWGYEVGAASDETAGVISSRVGPITLEIPSVSITANLSQSANSSSGLVEVQGPITITRPNSDLSVIGWTSSNGDPLYDDIDEETPSDTDYITSPELTSTPVGATFGLTSSLSAGSYNISVRGRRTDTGGQMRVVLRDSGGVQVGATNWQTLTNTYTTYSFPITITGTATQSSVEARTENTFASIADINSTATTETSVLFASGVTSDTNSITTTETSVLVPGGPVYVAGLFKGIYTGYFNDYTPYFDEFSPYATSVQTTQIFHSDDNDFYSVQWVGYFKPTTTETHTFFLNSDDASYMWIGPTAVTGFDTGNPLINNGGEHGAQEFSGSIALTAGQYYPVRIMFGEAEGDAVLEFNYETPTIAKTTNVTGKVFYNPATNGF